MPDLETTGLDSFIVIVDLLELLSISSKHLITLDGLLCFVGGRDGIVTVEEIEEIMVIAWYLLDGSYGAVIAIQSIISNKQTAKLYMPQLLAAQTIPSDLLNLDERNKKMGLWS